MVCVARATAAGSMVSPSSGSAGAITGTLRSGSASSGDTKIVLPLSCMVYCEAPTTVARMPSIEGSRRGQKPSTRARISAASSGPRSPNLRVSLP